MGGKLQGSGWGGEEAAARAAAPMPHTLLSAAWLEEGAEAALARQTTLLLARPLPAGVTGAGACRRWLPARRGAATSRGAASTSVPVFTARCCALSLILCEPLEARSLVAIHDQHTVFLLQTTRDACDTVSA